jgi:hypothetical protein
MIFVECKPDTTLARSLAGGIIVEHLHGKSRVCNKLMDNTNSKGMVDHDEETQTHPYIKEIISSGHVQELSDDDLMVYTDTAKNNIIVMLKPRLEEWIIRSAQIAGISMPESYNLPNTAEDLHLALSIGDRGNINSFRMLVQRLVSNSTRVEKLAKLLR